MPYSCQHCKDTGKTQSAFLGRNSKGEDGLEKLVEGVKQSKKLKSLDMVRSGLTSKSGLILDEVLVYRVFHVVTIKVKVSFLMLVA